MRIRRYVASVALGVGLIAGTAVPSALAGDNDLVLSRLGTAVDATGRATVDLDQATDVRGDNLAFRSLASQLGVVMAPRLMTPSDTLGFGGFQFTVDLQFTEIDNTATYWRALASSPDPAATDIAHGNNLLPTIGFYARKGIWFPVPSFEFGLGATHLLDSSIWSAQGYIKLALHEGFHDLPVPSAAVRAGASRVMGTEQIDLTIASLDVSISKDFGFQSTLTLSPYAGWNLLWVVPRSEVIDKTPHIDLADDPMDINMNFAFKDQSNITRNRFFGGFKIDYYVFQVTFEAVIALAGKSTDDRLGTDTDCADVPADMPTTVCDSTDAAAAQESYTVSVGFDF